jgi:hypothetical protein
MQKCDLVLARAGYISREQRIILRVAFARYRTLVTESFLVVASQGSDG